MKKINILLVLGVILFIVILSHFAQREQEKINALNPMVLEEKSKLGWSFWGSVIKTLVTKRPKTDGKSLILSANSDTSQCSTQPTIEQKVMTQFATYVLEYPCTARGHGSIRIYFDENNNPYQKYDLYLGAALGSSEEPIWRLGPQDNKRDKMSVLIYLQSDGKVIPVPSLVMQMKEKHKVQEIQAADLALYRKGSRVVGFLMGEKDASGHSPAIACSISKSTEVEEIFNPLYGLKKQDSNNCIALWMLTKDISLSVHSIKRQYAYRFKEIFQHIDQELQKTIIRVPELNNQSYKDSKNEPQQKLTDFGLNNEFTVADISFSTEPRHT